MVITTYVPIIIRLLTMKYCINNRNYNSNDVDSNNSERNNDNGNIMMKIIVTEIIKINDPNDVIIKK